jgi:ketosteroid isomerase-like protein
MSDREEVLEAVEAFYDAFASLDSDKMEAVWLRDLRIICVHPGWDKLKGWGPVMASWQRIFEGVFEMKFEIGEMDIIISGDIAVVLAEENLEQRGYDGIARSRVLATNIFERVGQKWLMIMHHGSPVIAPPNDESTLQ